MRTPSFVVDARRLTARLPRRGAIALLPGVIASLLGRGRSTGVAACTRVGKKCDSTAECCGRAKCKNGKCRCKHPYIRCGRRCFNRKYDENHCGNCTTVCGPTETCCSGLCIDALTNIFHCGACNTSCAFGWLCDGGTCVEQ